MPTGLCLIDLDGTLREGRTITHLATRFGVAKEVDDVLAADLGPHASRAQSDRVMACFAGVPADDFAAACAELPCRPDARALVSGLQERDFRVGIVTASYAPAAAAAQTATGADLVAAIVPEVDKGRLTGRLEPVEWQGSCGRMVCKETVLDAWKRAHEATFTVAIGNADNDLCMFESADLAVSVTPSTEDAIRASHAQIERLGEVLALVDAALGRGTVGMSTVDAADNASP